MKHTLTEYWEEDVNDFVHITYSRKTFDNSDAVYGYNISISDGSDTIEFQDTGFDSLKETKVAANNKLKELTTPRNKG